MSRFTERHAVPETDAGILYQFERALYHLATTHDRGALVGIETDDDVAVRSPTRSIAEQDKLSYQSQGHPFQDRSVGLWKTLSIWANASAAGGMHTTAELHLVTVRPVPVQCLAQRLSAASSQQEADACAKELERIASDPSETIARYTTFLQEVDPEVVRDMIGRIHLFAGETTARLRAAVITAIHLEPGLDDALVFRALLGWMHDAAQAYWGQRKPCWISREEFDRQYHAILRQIGRSRRRERAEALIPIAPADAHSARAHRFVERLLEIDMDDEEIGAAIEAFLRFRIEQLRLAQEGDVTGCDWDEFFSGMRGRWQAIARRTRRALKARPTIVVGQEIYDQTLDPNYRAPLCGEATFQTYLTAGGYHRLADVGDVWWLPEQPPDLVGGEQ